MTYRPELIRAVSSGTVQIEYRHGHTDAGHYCVTGEHRAWRVGFKGVNADGSGFAVLDVAGPYEDQEDAEDTANAMNADLDKLRTWLATLTDADRKYLDHRAAND
ncbi:hypothetical protein FBY14_12442 [Azospirillum brasilense]|nr:hypothetical protein FBY14_12442 [Azospirillum brasilense]